MTKLYKVLVDSCDDSKGKDGYILRKVNALSLRFYLQEMKSQNPFWRKITVINLSTGETEIIKPE